MLFFFLICCWCCSKLKGHKGYCVNREESTSYVCALSTSILFILCSSHVHWLVKVSLISWCCSLWLSLSLFSPYAFQSRHSFFFSCLSHSIRYQFDGKYIYIYAVHAHEFTDWIPGISEITIQHTFWIKTKRISMFHVWSHKKDMIEKHLMGVSHHGHCKQQQWETNRKSCMVDVDSHWHPVNSIPYTTFICAHVCLYMRDRWGCVVISSILYIHLIRLRTPRRTICRTQSLSSISHAHVNGHDYGETINTEDFML